MIGEAITAIVLGSLWVANKVEQRMHEDGDEPELVEKIYPFESFSDNTGRCALCAVERYDGTSHIRGPYMPKACKRSKDCPGYPTPHLHVACKSCGGAYLMHMWRK